MLSPYRIVINRCAASEEAEIRHAVRELFPTATVIFETWPAKEDLVLEVGSLNGEPLSTPPADVQEVLNRWLTWAWGRESAGAA